MLKKVTTWVQAHPDTRMDSHAFMACMFDLSVSSAEETMFRACWSMVQDFARLSDINGSEYTGAATEAVIESPEKRVVAIVAWPDRNSHVTAYRGAVGVARRAASAVRHDIGRTFSRRFF